MYFLLEFGRCLRDIFLFHFLNDNELIVTITIFPMITVHSGASMLPYLYSLPDTKVIRVCLFANGLSCLPSDDMGFFVYMFGDGRFVTSGEELLLSSTGDIFLWDFLRIRCMFLQKGAKFPPCFSNIREFTIHTGTSIKGVSDILWIPCIFLILKLFEEDVEKLSTSLMFSSLIYAMKKLLTLLKISLLFVWNQKTVASNMKWKICEPAYCFAS